MATIDDWNKYINLLHELALIEDDLRELSKVGSAWADTVLYERFGLDTL